VADEQAYTSRTPNPESRIPNPESQNLKLETRNPNPESRIPKPESRNPELWFGVLGAFWVQGMCRHNPATRNPQPATRNQQAWLRVQGYLAHKKQRPPRIYSRTMTRALWQS